jgi:hypothetical protein
MFKLILLTATVLAFASPAFAWDTPPPKPAPPTQVQGQVQGQGQQQTAKGGAGGNGGNGGNAAGGNASSNPTVNVNNGASASGGGANSSGGNNGGGWGGAGTFPASSSYAPSFALASICQEAISGGLSVIWAGGSVGRVYTLQFCKTKMKADYFRSLGRDDMAKAAECKDEDFRSLYKETGTPCREDMSKAELAQPTAPAPRAGYVGPNGFVPYPAGYKP